MTAMFAVMTATSMASPAFASPTEVVSVTVDCVGPVSLTADVGDTIVITLAHPGCNGESDGNGGNYANFNNLNGSYYAPEVHYNGTATGPGFLNYVSDTSGVSPVQTDRWFVLDPSHIDWWVMQSAANAPDIVITATLSAVDGNGTAIQVGSVVGSVFTEDTEHGLLEFPLVYAGPRTVVPQDNTEAASSSLASTGNNVEQFLLCGLVIVGLGITLRKLSIRRKSQ